MRSADITDCEDIFEWRNDARSLAMFFNPEPTSFEEHKAWFKKSLLDEDRVIYMGESGMSKVGICRFDFNQRESLAEVSINMNPRSRGVGLGKKFLSESINRYLRQYKRDLLAKVKPENVASLKIFESAGFELISSNSDMVTLRRSWCEIHFKEVVEEDVNILFELLKQREYSISHQILPSKEEHISFVKAKPYRYWAIVFENDDPVGTYYLQADNSIGLNLLRPTRRIVSEVLENIRENFEPLGAVKSKVPSYFYVNVAIKNKELCELLLELGAMPLQTSYKI